MSSLKYSAPMLATLALVGTCVSLPSVAGPPPRLRPGMVASHADLRDVVLNHYVVTVVRGKDGRWHLSLGTRGAPPVIHFCHPEEPRPRNEMAVLAVFECAGGISTFTSDVKKALRRAEAEIRPSLNELGLNPSREEIVMVQRLANSRLRQILVENGWLDRALDAWEKHAAERSTCFERKLDEYRRQIARWAAQNGVRCDDWSSYLRFCTSEGRRVADHVKLMSGLSPPEEVRRTILSLLKAGLADCLAKIVEMDAPDLAEEVTRLQANREHPSTDPINRRAWQLWRRRGVDRWYEIVRREGKVPEKLRLKILQCAGGYLPPVVDEEAGGQTGSGAPTKAPAPPKAP